MSATAVAKLPDPEPVPPPAASVRAVERAAPPPLVKSIGRYQVGRLLGEGAMGRVYLASDPELGREVAIKILRLEAAGGARDAYIARFRNEARAAARFNHPNVVSVYDAGVDPTLGPYLVYEFVPGRTLRGRIAEGQLDPAELVHLARGIGSALDALHAAGIIHRDIKPDNILIAPDGTVKLTDFGIARVPDAALTRDGQFLGTPAYAAPEAITRGEYSARGDVFSLAAVLYESLCTTRPFPGEDAVSVSYAVANDTPPPPSKHVPGVPPAVDAAFARGLAKRATDRFESAGELAGALYSAFRAANASSVGATSTQAVPLLAKRPQHPSVAAKPEPPSALAPAVVTAILVAALAIFLARHFASPPAAAPTPSPAIAPSATPHAAPAPYAPPHVPVHSAPTVRPRVTHSVR